MLLSRTCTNALRAAIEVAARTRGAPGRYVPVHRVAEAIGVSRHFLGKIAQSLVEAGILRSLRGPNGGVGLARPAGEIPLIEVVYATDGPDVLERCLLGLPQCSEREPCPLHDSWAEARDGLVRRLEGTTLAAVAGRRADGGGRPRLRAGEEP